MLLNILNFWPRRKRNIFEVLVRMLEEGYKYKDDEVCVAVVTEIEKISKSLVYQSPESIEGLWRFIGHKLMRELPGDCAKLTAAQVKLWEIYSDKPISEYISSRSSLYIQ